MHNQASGRMRFRYASPHRSLDGYDIIDSGAAFLSGISPDERRPFLDGLVTVAEDRSNGDALANDLLKSFAEAPHATRIYLLAKATRRI